MGAAGDKKEFFFSSTVVYDSNEFCCYYFLGNFLAAVFSLKRSVFCFFSLCGTFLFFPSSDITIPFCSFFFSTLGDKKGNTRGRKTEDHEDWIRTKTNQLLRLYFNNDTFFYFFAILLVSEPVCNVQCEHNFPDGMVAACSSCRKEERREHILGVLDVVSQNLHDQ